jgi:hypothetical protein
MVFKPNTAEFHLRVKALLAVRHGRELAERMANTSRLPIGDLPQSAVNACVGRLQMGQVTDGRDRAAIEVIHECIVAALINEVIETRLEWMSLGYEAGEEIWKAEAVPVYSVRGRLLYNVLLRIERFIEVRQNFIDHANAERLEREHLR